MKNTWKGLVVGGLTGVGAGIVLDVVAGAAGKAREMGERAPGWANKARHSAERAADRVREAELGDKARQTAERVRESDLGDKAREVAERVRETDITEAARDVAERAKEKLHVDEGG